MNFKLNNTNILFAGCVLQVNPQFHHLISYVVCIIGSSVTPFIFGLAILVFIWGVVQYIAGAEEEAKREKGRQFIIWGLIGIFAMISVWGLVRVLNNTFGVPFVVPRVHVNN
ncbi:MAG: hypothetical protein V4504_00950 [Patescibacteria group bacterium]